MAKLTISTRPAHETSGDALVVGLLSGPGGPALAPGHGLPRRTVNHLRSVIGDLELAGRPGEVTTLAAVPDVTTRLVMLAGVGELRGRPEPEALEDVRRGFGAAIRTLATKKSLTQNGAAGRTRRKAVVVVPGSSVAVVSATAEGAALGAYGVTKVGGGGFDAVSTIALVGPADVAARKAVKRAMSVAAAVRYARDLVNLPPNLLYPESFVESLRAKISRKGSDGGKTGLAKVTLESHDLAALRQGGFGGVVGVGQGSANEPRVAVLTYAPARPKASIALVGKGITFDSGGLCIKPAASMVTMKSDMAGAAAAAAVVLASAELGLPVAVTAYLGLAENMPGAMAQRPGDVVTMRGGKTVEIIDTDAEGRMVLGDCLALATESRPDVIVDIATLTGAQTVALADTAAVMGNDDAFRSRVLDAAAASGEAMWPMPLPADLRPNLESATADLAHKGPKEGGMLTAGLFLGEFVGDGIPWTHIDIAGPSFNTKEPSGYTPKGGTGFGVRTLVKLVETYA